MSPSDCVSSHTYMCTPRPTGLAACLRASTLPSVHVCAAGGLLVLRLAQAPEGCHDPALLRREGPALGLRHHRRDEAAASWSPQEAPATSGGQQRGEFERRQPVRMCLRRRKSERDQPSRMCAQTSEFPPRRCSLLVSSSVLLQSDRSPRTEPGAPNGVGSTSAPRRRAGAVLGVLESSFPSSRFAAGAATRCSAGRGSSLIHRRPWKPKKRDARPRTCSERQVRREAGARMRRRHPRRRRLRG